MRLKKTCICFLVLGLTACDSDSGSVAATDVASSIDDAMDDAEVSATDQNMAEDVPREVTDEPAEEPPVTQDLIETDLSTGEPDLASEPDVAWLTADECLRANFVGDPEIGPDYDQFHPIVGSHCLGTNHQDIQNIERVVFLGDSVTAGSPPTVSTEYYRALLADMLAEHFDLTPPEPLWKAVNFAGNGRSYEWESGDFANCAEWGARTDDLLREGVQINSCFPDNERRKTTLVVFTIGGNDIASMTGDGLEGVPVEQIWEDNREFVRLLDEAVAWLREPDRFPNGVHIVFSNMFEFTDGTGETTACPAAGLAGFGAEWEDVDALADIVIWANEQFMRIAVDYRADMIFMLETFCGHGFNARDPRGPCYRGFDTPRWFDLTCIHPNPEGHKHIADMFMATIAE